MVVVDQHEYLCEEEKRLKEDRERKKYWKKWGPYVAERQWATGACLPSVYSRNPTLTMSLQLERTTREFSNSICVQCPLSGSSHRSSEDGDAWSRKLFHQQTFPIVIS